MSTSSSTTTAGKMRAARARSGLTQQELASAARVGIRSVARWEAGGAEPRRHQREAIETALGVELGSLAGDRTVPDPDAPAPMRRASDRSARDLSSAIHAHIEDAVRREFGALRFKATDSGSFRVVGMPS